MKRVLGALAAAVVLLAGFTWWALESGGVAIVETRDPAGGVRSTHVWYVEEEGELWLEAGTPENAWFRDVQADPAVTFRSERAEGAFVARPAEDPARHDELRAKLRAKYGVRDWWVSLFVDQSESLAVRLFPAGASER